MFDHMTNVLWMLALRIAGGVQIPIDLESWPAAYRSPDPGVAWGSMPCSTCSLAALCDACRSATFDRLRGVAACRGEAWADDVARRVPRDRPWPVDGPRTAAIALRKVADLTDDERLRCELAREAVRWAARRWDATRAPPTS